ncbi:hypothetical protein SC65A3_00961 [Psychrobacter sp. SC65A.3]|uniref:hypothetical protein n=1 Tax=Psychrobacter sp. SC65A.3 TaxID=2983299 RepID=UPI0021D9EE4B|nr:hypothetical protein [Psychrobacter sp. SC65A.3]WAI87502.1 hypothetical protein SC65A3_00961 [Psychrobacter sp. SC65A.3]
MANSEQQIRAYIKSEQRKGTSDAKIVVGMTSIPGQAGKDAQKMIKALRAADLSPAQEIGEYFGLKTTKLDPKATTKNKNATLADKAKSTNYSAMTGVAKSFGKVAQVANSGLDAVSGGINKALGTKIPTGNRAAYDRDVAAMDARKNQLRDQANYSGVDLGELTGDIAAKAPLYVAGGAPGAGLKGLGAFAGREAAIGGLDGSLRHSKSTAEQVGNTALGAIGGAVGGVAGVTVGKGVGYAGKQVARRGANKSGATATAATKLVDDAIRDTGIAVKPAARAKLVNEATKNLSKSKQIDAAAAVRKSLLDDNGIKGTRAQISRNPQEWAAERELAKQDGNPLNSVHTNNNEQIASKWQSLADETGATPTDTNTRMASTFQTLKQGDDAAKANVSGLYDNARASAGNDVPLDHMRFINNASQELEAQGLGTFLKGDIRGIFKGMFDDPNFQLTLGKSEEINKVLNARLKTTTDGNERYALGLVKDHLAKEVDETMNALGGGAGKQASEAWTGAKGAHASRMQAIESNPALKAALDDKAPDDAFKKYVLNADERDLVRLVDDLKSTPEGTQNLADLQGETIEHFLTRATQANNGAFSPAQLNKAINSFGDNRMKALFSPQQIARINDIKQVSDILMQQPLGAHVNHSNTSSALINALVGVAGWAGKIPLGIGHLSNVATGGVTGAVNMSKKGAAATATAKAMNGQAGITRGSGLGLTDEQMKLLGLIPQRTGQAGAAVGAGASN